jgi:hypothetical protein
MQYSNGKIYNSYARRNVSGMMIGVGGLIGNFDGLMYHSDSTGRLAGMIVLLFVLFAWKITKKDK